MKIAISTNALKTDYRLQGTGNYISNLVNGLKERVDGNNYFSCLSGEKIDADIYHLPYFSPYELVLPASKPATRLVVTVHDLIPVIFDNFFPVGPKGKLKWYLQKFWRSRFVDHVICDSYSTQTDVIEYLDVPMEKTSVVYLAADEQYRRLDDDRRSLRRQMQEKYNLPEKFALYVGDVVWSKNLPSLVEAAKQINVTLVLAGKQLMNQDVDLKHPWNSDLIKVREMIRDDKRFITLGYVPDEDLVKLYNLAMVYCQPSHYEGFGIPVLEAMACGCPVVTSREGSLPEIAGDAGIYVSAGDVRSIADGIGETFFNAVRYQELSKLGMMQAQKFSWSKTIDETIEVYNRVVEK